MALTTSRQTSEPTMTSTPHTDGDEIGSPAYMSVRGARLLTPQERAQVAHLLPARPSWGQRLARFLGFRA